MDFQYLDISGGVVIPGTAYVEYDTENLLPEYEVIADVFDSSMNPGQRVTLTIHRTPYFSVAEWYCDWGNSGVAPPFDLATILPSEPDSYRMAV